MTNGYSRDEAALRRAMEAQAARIEVAPDALPEIRRRIAERRWRWLPRGGAMFAIGSGVAAATATVVFAVVGLGSCAPTNPTPNPPADSSGTPSAITTGPAPTTPSTGTSSGSGGAPASLAIYYLGQDRNRVRLYREFHRIPAGDGTAAAKVRAAVTEMLAKPAADPDYSRGWPTGATVRNATVNGTTVTVDLAGAAQNNVGSEAAHQAVQQLVWTVAAATGGNAGVRILLDGKAVPELWGHVDIRNPIRKSAAVDVLALVWIIDPQHGAQVGRTFTLNVYGSVFESTVNYRILRGTQVVVPESFVTLATDATGFGSARKSITLPPGTYTLEAYELSANDGSVQHLDDHTFTVG